MAGRTSIAARLLEGEKRRGLTDRFLDPGKRLAGVARPGGRVAEDVGQLVSDLEDESRPVRPADREIDVGVSSPTGHRSGERRIRRVTSRSKRQACCRVDKARGEHRR